MNSVNRNREAWDRVRLQIRPGTDAVRVVRSHVPHPRDAGARSTTTWPTGQIADYALDGGAGEPPLLIREFSDRFEAFVGTAQVAGQVIGFMERDPKAAMYVGGALLGGAIGSSVSGKKEGMLLGAGVGLLFAALLDASLNDGRRA
jgi:hypothetical protein